MLIANVAPRAVASRIAPAENAPFVEDLGIHSVMIVPLSVHGRLLGILSVCRRNGGTAQPFNSADLALLEDLARRAALVVRQAQVLDELRTAVTARDEFLSIASHELRTPVTALRLQLEAIGRSFERDPDDKVLARTRKVVPLALAQSRRLTTLIHGLLDVSRIARGTFELSLEEVDLRALLVETVEAMAETAQRAGVRIQLHAPEPLVGRWDATRLDQALMNVVSNAIKYAPGAPLDITAIREGATVSITLTDGGPGIAPEDLERIFGRFEQGVSSRQYGGLGWYGRSVNSSTGIRDERLHSLSPFEPSPTQISGAASIAQSESSRHSPPTPRVPTHG